MKLPEVKTLMEALEGLKIEGPGLLEPAEPPITLTESLKETVAEAVRSTIIEFFTETWAYIKVDLISSSYIVVLVGGSICIVLYVAGWEKGMRYLGIMFVGHILLRAILG